MGRSYAPTWKGIIRDKRKVATQSDHDGHKESLARLFKRGLVHLPRSFHLRTPELGEIQILKVKLLDKSRDKIGDLPWFSLKNQMRPLN